MLGLKFFVRVQTFLQRRRTTFATLINNNYEKIKKDKMNHSNDIVLLDDFRFLRKSQMKNIQFNDSMIKQIPK